MPHRSEHDPCVFITIQLAISSILSLITAISLNYISINGTPIEPIRFSFDLLLLAISVIVAVIAGAICWALRTIALKHVDINVYTIMLSISAIVTTIISIMVGTDKISADLIIGAVLIILAVVVSGLGDIIRDKRKKLE